MKLKNNNKMIDLFQKINFKENIFMEKTIERKYK